MRSTVVSVSKIGTCAALVLALVLPSQAWADTQPEPSEVSAEETASQILDEHLDLTVEDALRMTEDQNIEDATIEMVSTPEGEFEVEITRAGAKAMHIVCTGANSGGKALGRTHYSKGGGGAIFKTKIKCTGYGAATVRLREQGLLSFAAAKNAKDTANKTFKPRATSDYWQTITVNGKPKTYYTPKPGKNGGLGKGFWISTSTWYFTASGVTSTVGTETNLEFLTIEKG